MVTAEDTQSWCAQDYIDEGLRLHARGQKAQALRLYQQGLRLDPENALGRYASGLALQALGRSEEASLQWRLAAASPQEGESAAWARTKAHALIGHYAERAGDQPAWFMRDAEGPHGSTSLAPT